MGLHTSFPRNENQLAMKIDKYVIFIFDTIEYSEFFNVVLTRLHEKSQLSTNTHIIGSTFVVLGLSWQKLMVLQSLNYNCSWWAQF